MSSFTNSLWPILLAIYIISPLDAHPLFFDDLIASAVLFYLLFKNAKQKKESQKYRSSYSRSEYKATNSPHEPLTLDEAYSILGIKRDSTLGDVKKAYWEKISLSHPDKVSHLSKEIQEKAEELTLKLNNAYDLIKSRKKG